MDLSRRSGPPRKCKTGKGAGNQQNQPIKAVLFVPHTHQSGLAKRLKENEESIKNVTGYRVKVVERAGFKIQDILTGKDPWKGADCGRENCFVCSTKVLTGKGLNKDCSKRNIIYEIKCLTCEAEEKARIQEIAGEDLEMLKEMRQISR